MFALAFRRNTKTNLDHDDVMTSKCSPHCWPFVRGIHQSPVDSPYMCQWAVSSLVHMIESLSFGSRNLSEIIIHIEKYSCKKMHGKMLYVKCSLFCRGFSVYYIISIEIFSHGYWTRLQRDMHLRYSNINPSGAKTRIFWERKVNSLCGQGISNDVIDCMR